MADNLPEPKSRKESYLAKAAGMDVTVPEAPESREEQYLAAIAEGGGGGGGSINVINNLESTSTTDALSANMGRMLSYMVSDAQDIIYFTEELPEPDFPEEEPDGYYIPAFSGKLYLIESPIKIYYTETDYIDNFSGWWFYNQISMDEETGYGTYAYTIFKGNGANNVPEIYVGQAADTEDGYVNLSFEQVGAGGGGGIRDLTNADLDFPVGNPSGIALWNLDAGIYRNATDSEMYLNYSSTQTFQRKTLRAGDVFTVLSKRNYNGVLYTVSQVGLDSYYDADFVYANGSGLGSVLDVVSFNKVADNLTTGSSGLYVLDAHQGYVLNQKITPTTDASAPTTSTQGELGKIFIDTTNDDAYMCVKASGGTYTWKKITP